MKNFLIIFSEILSIFLFSPVNVNAQTILNGQDSIQLKPKMLVFTRVETEASFPGGRSAWEKYIWGEIKKSQLTENDRGTCTVKFVVDKDGNIIDAQAITMVELPLAKVIIEALENGPKWIPAQQNNRNVNAWHTQSVTFEPTQKKRSLSTGPQSNYVRIKDIKKNTAAKDFDKILILGIGSASVRLVVDNLYEKLAIDLKDRKIESAYFFLGNNGDDASRKLKQILQNDNYEALMFFTQADISQLSESYYLRELPRALIKLDQAVAIRLVDINDSKNSIWEAMMEMNFTLTGKKVYQKISDLIIKNMKDNLLCDLNSKTTF